ncbi:MAG: hypothetical protein JWO94_2554 [Verrucomicrobiaceae bacterium]|nr:hypothetical protein [Verrucomicrobiaceae bacterium]
MKPLALALLFWVPALLALAQSAPDLIADGDRLDSQQKTGAALKVYLQAEKLDASNASLLIKIAKQYGESMTDKHGDEEKRKAGDTALAYSQRAAKLAPKMSDAQLAVAICYGRLLDLVPVRTRVEYSRLVHDFTQKAIDLDPKSDYAWHMLGRWNQAVATMGTFTKGIVSVVYGGLPDASLEKSKECFEKALKIREDRVSHHIELGRTLAFMGRKDDARKQIESGLAMPNKERDDPDTKERGRETLKTL